MRLAMAITCALALAACSDDGNSGGPRVVPGPPCPTDLEQVSSQVFQPGCIDAGCHGSGDRAGGLDLEATALELELFGRESALCGGETRVIAGDGESSLLVMKLRGSTDCGTRMPIGGILAGETVDCIAAWIDQLESLECLRDLWRDRVYRSSNRCSTLRHVRSSMFIRGHVCRWWLRVPWGACCVQLGMRRPRQRSRQLRHLRLRLRRPVLPCRRMLGGLRRSRKLLGSMRRYHDEFAQLWSVRRRL